MAPRKAKVSKSTPKPIAPKPSASKSRTKASQESMEQPVIPYTSQAARKRRQPTCSMASLLNIENEETIEKNFTALFGAHSENHFTWGKTEAKPITAIKRKGRKGPRLCMKQIGKFPRGLFPWIDEVCLEPIIPNSPSRSPFLSLPLEVREEIYSQLLIYKRPIIVQYSWDIVEHKLHNKNQNAIVSVCKQISHEATSFLYRRSAFRVILRPPPSNFYYRDTFSIAAKFVPLFKNVIIQCERDYYHLQWLEKAVDSVKTLSQASCAGCALDALTIVTFPQRVGMSDTAMGREARPITFADWFYEKGGFMTELKKLNCKILNVVIKKVDEEGKTTRLLISLDLKYLHAGTLEKGLLANEETIRLARVKAEKVEKELIGLKKRFEEVFENDDAAQMEGKCRLLDEEETYENGLKLVEGTCRGL